MTRKDLARRTKADLVAMAKGQRVPRYSRMTKEELVRVLAVEPSKQAKRKRSRSHAQKAVPTGGETGTRPARNARQAVPKRRGREKPERVNKIYRAGRPKKKIGASATRGTHEPRPEAPPERPVPGEETIEASKYGSPAPRSYPFDEGFGELPAHYDEDRIGLLPRDPRWLFSFWDLSTASRHDAERSGATDFRLRLYDVTDGMPRDLATSCFLDIAVGSADNWFLEVARPGRTFVAQIGWVGRDGTFHATASSRPTSTPWDRIQEVTAPIRFVRIPFEVPLSQLRELLRTARQHGKTLAEALHEMGYDGDVPAGMSPDEFLRLYAAAQALAPGVSSLDLADRTAPSPSDPRA